MVWNQLCQKSGYYPNSGYFRGKVVFKYFWVCFRLGFQFVGSSLGSSDVTVMSFVARITRDWWHKSSFLPATVFRMVWSNLYVMILMTYVRWWFWYVRLKGLLLMVLAGNDYPFPLTLFCLSKNIKILLILVSLFFFFNFPLNLNEACRKIFLQLYNQSEPGISINKTFTQQLPLALRPTN